MSPAANGESLKRAAWLLLPVRSGSGFRIDRWSRNFADFLALHRAGYAPQWHPTAALVVEIVSPGDKSWDKLGFTPRTTSTSC